MPLNVAASAISLQPPFHDATLLARWTQDLKEKIQQRYRVRLILDNLPVTTYDLKLDPESVRPGFELGFVAGDRHYIHNHLMFNILVRSGWRRCDRVQPCSPPLAGWRTPTLAGRTSRRHRGMARAAADPAASHIRCNGLACLPLDH